MYKAMYLHLFNACTDALRALEVRNIWEAQRILTEAQCAAEEMYISSETGGESGRIVEIFGETDESQ